MLQRKVTSRHNRPQMIILFPGSRYSLRHCCNSCVNHKRQLQSDRPDKSALHSGSSQYITIISEGYLINPDSFGYFNLIYLMIAPDKHGKSFAVTFINQCLDDALRLNLQLRFQLINGP
ncbi:hypothetical protein D3C76_1620690 [compost metagenome]